MIGAHARLLGRDHDGLRVGVGLLVDYEGVLGLHEGMPDDGLDPLDRLGLRVVGLGLEHEKIRIAQEVARIHVVGNDVLGCLHPHVAVAAAVDVGIVPVDVVRGTAAVGKFYPRTALGRHRFIPVQPRLHRLKLPVGIDGVQRTQILPIAFGESLRLQILLKGAVEHDLAHGNILAARPADDIAHVGVAVDPIPDHAVHRRFVQDGHHRAVGQPAQMVGAHRAGGIAHPKTDRGGHRADALILGLRRHGRKYRRRQHQHQQQRGKLQKAFFHLIT